MKEFRLTLRLPLPDDKFAEARLIAALENPLTTFLGSLSESLPEGEGCVVEHDIVSLRKKADETQSAGFTRKRKPAAE